MSSEPLHSATPGSNTPQPAGNGPANYNQPVAYDTQGRPLYLHPTQVGSPAVAANVQAEPQPQYVHVARPMAPEETEIPPHIMERHVKAVKQYPRLNLSKGEYIISAVRRHPIGLVEIWGSALVLIVLLSAVLVGALSGSGLSDQSVILAAFGLGVFSLLVLAGAFVAAYVYSSNHFFLTNESVIQEIRTSLFNKHEQTVSLANIEDASYRKTGILSHVFDYGTIRLSTEGDETTYRFSYVANPKKHIAVLNNAVEAFKNGRPVDPPNDDQSS